MKYIHSIATGIFFLSLTIPAFAQDYSAGEAIFIENKCQGCHSADNVKKQGPFLQTIANTYQDEEKLLLYMKGESDPIVEPERAKTMKIRRRKLKKLTPQQQKELSQYILSFRQ